MSSGALKIALRLSVLVLMALPVLCGAALAPEVDRERMSLALAVLTGAQIVVVGVLLAYLMSNPNERTATDD